MVIIGTLAGLVFIYVLLRVFFPIKNEKVESSKSVDFDDYCVGLYGKHQDELTSEERNEVLIAYTRG